MTGVLVDVMDFVAYEDIRRSCKGGLENERCIVDMYMRHTTSFTKQCSLVVQNMQILLLLPLLPLRRWRQVVEG